MACNRDIFTFYLYLTYLYSVDKLIHASIANHYDSDVSGSLHGTKQTKSSYLEIT
jgi:hypothetical protein